MIRVLANVTMKNFLQNGTQCLTTYIHISLRNHFNRIKIHKNGTKCGFLVLCHSCCSSESWVGSASWAKIFGRFKVMLVQTDRKVHRYSVKQVRVEEKQLNQTNVFSDVHTLKEKEMFIDSHRKKINSVSWKFEGNRKKNS